MYSTVVSRGFCALILSLSLMMSSARAQTTLAFNVSTGNWSTAGSWTPNAIPNNGQPLAGDLYNATISNGGTATLNASDIVIQSLLFTNGTINGTFNLTLNAASTWTGGTFSGTGAINIAGGMTIDSGNNKILAQTINNTSSVVFMGTNTIFGNTGGVWNNNSGATFDIQAAGINFNPNSGNAIFNNNAGAVFKKSAGGGTNAMSWAFTNVGTVLAQNDTIQFRGGSGAGTYGATTTISNGATVDFAVGAFVLANGGSASSLTTGGTFLVSGATFTTGNVAGETYTVNSPFTFTNGTINGPGNFILTNSLIMNGGGTFNSPSSFTLPNAFNWTGGTLAGGATAVTTTNGGVTLNGTAGNMILGRTIANSSTATLTGTANFFGNTGGFWENNSGGTFDIQSNVNLNNNAGSGTFNNNTGGVFQKSTTAGTTTVSWLFNNAGGTVKTTLSGVTLVFSSAGNWGGLVNVTAGSLVQFISGTKTLLAGGGTTGAGTVEIVSGNINLPGSGNTYSVGSIGAMSGGNLIGSGIFSITGPSFSWTTGVMGNATVDGLTTVSSISTLSISTPSTPSLNQSLENSGIVILSGASGNFQGNSTSAAIVNKTGGLFDIQSNSGLSSQGTFTNQASADFQKSAGTGTSTIAWNFNNSGNVKNLVSGSTLNFTGGGNWGGIINISNGAIVQFASVTKTLVAGGSTTGSGSWIFTSGIVNLPGSGNSYTVGSLATLSGGLFSGSGTLAITGPTFNWTSGTLGNATPGGLATVSVSSTFNITSDSFPSLNQSLDNSGTITLSGTSGNFQGLTVSAVLTNLAGGLFDIQSNVGMSSSGTFNNQLSATFQKSAGVGTSTIGWNFNNSGNVKNLVSGSTLTFSGVGNWGGTTAISSGATIQFSSGTKTLVAGGNSTGLGTFEFLNGTFNLPGSGNTFTVGSIGRFTGGAFSGSGTLAITGTTFAWTSGTLNGSSGGLTTVSNSTILNISTESIPALNQALDNSGTINLSGISSNLQGNSTSAVLTNLAGSLFNIQSNSGLSSQGVFNNQATATFQKSAGTGTSSISWTFNNSGTVKNQVSVSTLQFTGSGNWGGTIDISSGAIIQFTNNAKTLVAGGSSIGAGTLDFNAGTINLPGSGNTFNVGGLGSLTGSSFSGAGTLAITGPSFNWTSGVMGNANPAGLTTLASDSTMNVVTDAIPSLNQPFDNSGTVNLNGASGNLQGISVSAIITNKSSGVVDLLSNSGLSSTGSFNNQSGAIFRKSGGTGTSSIAWTFDNQIGGNVRVLAGILTFSSLHTNTLASGVLKTGNWLVISTSTPVTLNLPGGTITTLGDGVSGNSTSLTLNGPDANTLVSSNLNNTITTIANTGSFTITNGRNYSIGGGTGTLTNAGSLTVGPSSTLTAGTINSTGLINGNGTLNRSSGNITVNLNNGSTIAPGQSTGTLTVQGSVVANSTSTFNFEIGGTIQGSQGAGGYDFLNISQNLTLGPTHPTLNLNLVGGFVPAPTDKFIIVDSLSTLTTNDIFNGLPDGATVFFAQGNFTIHYNVDGSGANAGAIMLTDYSAVPEPSSILAILAIGGLIARRRANRVRCGR